MAIRNLILLSISMRMEMAFVILTNQTLDDPAIPAVMVVPEILVHCMPLAVMAAKEELEALVDWADKEATAAAAVVAAAAR
jgi:hypothetical protein